MKMAILFALYWFCFNLCVETAFLGVGHGKEVEWIGHQNYIGVPKVYCSLFYRLLHIYMWDAHLLCTSNFRKRKENTAAHFCYPSQFSEIVLMKQLIYKFHKIIFRWSFYSYNIWKRRKLTNWSLLCPCIQEESYRTWTGLMTAIRNLRGFSQIIRTKEK